MKRLLFGMMACVLGLGVTGEASAAPRKVVKKTVVVRGRSAPARIAGHRHGVARGYHLRHGVRYRGGYYYRGINHRHWSKRLWNPTYRRYHYWDPYVRCWYYYDPIRIA